MPLALNEVDSLLLGFLDNIPLSAVLWIDPFMSNSIIQTTIDRISDYVHVAHYGSIAIASLNKYQRERTCGGYWYLVYSGVQSHTAFRKRSNLLKWLELRNLTINGELPQQGERSYLSVGGEYRHAMHMNYQKFYGLLGKCEQSREMSNGDWTLSLLTRDDDDIVTVNYLNPNCRRQVFDRRESNELVG